MKRVQMKNRSSRQTKTRIREAFSALLAEEKQLNRITVTAIVKRCGIDRSTFYTYYDDIYAIVQELENEAVAVFFDKTPADGSGDVAGYFKRVFSYLRINEAHYRQALSCDEPNRFLDGLRRKVLDLLIRTLGVQNDRERTADITLFSYGLCHMLIDYFQNRTSYTLGELETATMRWVEMWTHFAPEEAD